MRIAVALREALVNAIYHGNLDLTRSCSSRTMPSSPTGRSAAGARTAYARRRVHVTARETRTEATYVIRDEGQGLRSAALPDPTSPQNLDARTGRGLFLIRTFMDEVRHNDVGNEITLVKRADGPRRD